MVRPGHRTHHPLPARAILPRDPARRTAQPEGTRGRYERGLVSQTPPHLQRYTRRCTATLLAGTGFCHVPPSRQGEETLPSAPGRHYLCALPRCLPRCLVAKVELSPRPAHQAPPPSPASRKGGLITVRHHLTVLNDRELQAPWSGGVFQDREIGRGPPRSAKPR